MLKVNKRLCQTLFIRLLQENVNCQILFLGFSKHNIIRQLYKRSSSVKQNVKFSHAKLKFFGYLCKRKHY